MFTPAKHIPSLRGAQVLLRGVPGVVLGVLFVFAELNAQGNQSPPPKDSFPASYSNFIRSSSSRARFILDSTYNTGSGPHFIGIGDWNGDSKLDLVIPHSTSNDVNTWLNLGSGIFSRNDIIPVAILPRVLTVGDFDSDGDLDLAVANEASDSVTIVNNDGQGNFLVRGLPILIGGQPSHITSGDMNRDGFLDLVIARYASSSILVLINGGDGSFNTQIPYSLNQRPVDSFLGDFDKDGFLDIVVTNSDDSTVSLLVNDQNGNFKAPQTFAAGIEPDFVLGQDFNRDGRLDLAVANRISNTISILFNQGGSFSTATDYPVGSDPLAITSGDWDGDSDPDLAVVNHQSEDLYMFSNDGAGQFQMDTIYATGARPRFVNSGDFDGDGDLDLAVANWGANNFQIFSNQRLHNQNGAPGAPQLFLPNNRAFVNPNLAALRLSWSVPLDQDNDSLHFRIEIDQNSDFVSPNLRFESKDATTGFSPAPPVGQSIDTVYFNFVAPLQDGFYWWRVTAWDGTVYGEPSQPKNFVIDTSPPKLDGFLLTNPVFPPNWYNPIRLSSINFGVQYDESYAQKAEFDLGAWGGMQLLENIPSGLDQTATVPVELTGAADGSYPLSVVLFDSAGNTVTGSRSISLDSTPPTGTRASSPDTSAKEKFVVSWGGTATDGAGAGISGVYDVRVQIDDGAWQDWLTNFAGNLAEYQGAHGHVYGFEATVRDNVGNIEAFAQIAETVTLADTNANDKSAPGPPPSLTAGGSNPSPWQQNPIFQITWQAPDDPSGIGKALYKLGISPAANFDTTGSVLVGSSLPISATHEGGQNFYLWFVDRRGNVDFRNHGVVTLRYDRTLPEIKGFDILNAEFQPYWYNQGKPNPAQIRINYSERHPQKLRLVSEPLNLNVEVTQPPGGDAAAYLFNAVIQDKPDGIYRLEFTLIDSAGNSVRDTTTIGLDNAPPTGAQASSPDTSATEKFLVSWGGTATDGAGAGISGKYDVQVQIDGGARQAWLTNFTGNLAEYQGAHGHKYGFEAAARDNVGNIEFYKGIPETVTFVDTTANDKNAPGPPQSLTASGSNPSPWQQNPIFQITWQAPDDPSGIGKALYKLGNSPAANFDTTGSVVMGSSFQITATQEDGQNFYLWFVDRRSNVDFRIHGVVTLRYDRTLPEIKGFDILNADFQPYWYNQGKPNPAQIRINYSERHPQKLRLVSEPLNLNVEVTQPPGGDAAAYLFNALIQDKPDGIYHLEFTLIDSAGNLARDTTTIALDNAPPTGARASAPDTSAAEKFVVSWGGTATDSAGAGISGTYNVQVQIDGGAWQAWLTNFTGNLAEYQGAQGHRYGFEVAARDNVGNIEAFVQIAEAVTMVDTSVADRTSPSIVHSPVSVVEEGENVNIQVQIQDDIRVDAAHLFYKQSGNRTYQSMPMTGLGGGIYQATLTSATISTKGVNYYVQASDGLNFSYHPQENWDTKPHNISVRIRGGANNQGLMKDEPQPGGNAQSAFRMISSPLILEDSSAQAVFEDDLGAYDPIHWRLFRFNPLAGDYSEFPDLESFSPGKAFWLIVRSPNKQIDSGIGTTVATNQPFQIALQQGWNDISNPFTFPVNWSDVQIIQGTSAEIMGPYTYRGQWLLPNSVTTLSPWEGYAVYSLIPSAIIAIPPIEAVVPPGPAHAKNDDKTDWRLGCAAVCEEALDGANSIGVSSNASVEWDELDYLEPPPIGDYVSLRFPHHDWQKFRGAFSTDFRPPFADGQVWHFEVATNIANAPIALKFQNAESLPAEFQAILRDLTTLVQIDIQQSPEYIFVPDQSRLHREFELVVGTAAYIENSDQQKQVAPKTFSLGQNFPNPFNAGTTLLYQVAEPSHVSIKIFNFYGQEIRRLVTQLQKPGRYQIRWDAKSDDEREIGSGIYFIQLEAGHFRQIRKVLLVR